MNTVSKEIIISSDSLVMDIQKAFNFYYPFLMIEFSKKEKHLIPSRSKVSPANVVGQLAKVAAPAKVSVADDRTVAEIESDFSALLGLTTKVFRKSGKVWNAISLTDSWTLESQNKAGEFISTEMAAV